MEPTDARITLMGPAFKDSLVGILVGDRIVFSGREDRTSWRCGVSYLNATAKATLMADWETLNGRAFTATVESFTYKMVMDFREYDKVGRAGFVTQGNDPYYRISLVATGPAAGRVRAHGRAMLEVRVRLISVGEWKGGQISPPR